MATREDEFEPDKFMVEAVVADAVRPVLVDCEVAAGDRFPVTISVWVLETEGLRIETFSSGREATTSPVKVEVRLRFRKTINPQRLLYRGEALFSGLPAESGTLGFELGGDILLSKSGMSIRGKHQTYRYNMPEWQGWLT